VTETDYDHRLSKMCEAYVHLYRVSDKDSKSFFKGLSSILFIFV